MGVRLQMNKYQAVGTVRKRNTEELRCGFDLPLLWMGPSWKISVKEVMLEQSLKEVRT